MLEGWRTTTLRRAAVLRYGKPLRETDRREGDVPVVGSAGQFASHDVGNASTTGGTIVVGRKGTAGSVTWFDGPAWVTDTAYWAEPVDGTVTLRFLSLMLEASDLPSVCAQTGVPGLNRERAYAISVAIPPLPEQRRIVDLIGALDDAISASAEAAADLMYQTVLSMMTVRFPQISINEVLAGAFAGGTPSRSKPEYFEGTIPWLKSGEIENDYISDTTEHISDEAFRSSAARLVPAGSTVLAMYGQGETKGRAGFVVSPVTTNQAVLALIPDTDRIDAKYLLHAVRSRTPSLRRRAVGAAQPNLSKALVLTESIPVPDELDEQVRLRELLDSVRSAQLAQDVLTARLRDTRSHLLHALLSGEHEIPESYDELMEVAS